MNKRGPSAAQVEEYERLMNQRFWCMVHGNLVKAREIQKKLAKMEREESD